MSTNSRSLPDIVPCIDSILGKNLANFKNYKIPKIKREEETNSEKPLKTEIIKHRNNMKKDFETGRTKIINKNKNRKTVTNIKKKSMTHRSHTVNLKNGIDKNNNKVSAKDLNVKASTSKKSPEKNSSVKGGIKINSENIVSSNDISSTSYTTINPKISEKLIHLLSNPKLLPLIEILQDEEKIEKLQKILESPVLEKKSKIKNILNSQHTKCDEKTKLKKKKINKVKSYLNNSDDDESTSFGNYSDQLSVGKIKSKSSKHKKSEKKYKSSAVSDSKSVKFSKKSEEILLPYKLSIEDQSTSKVDLIETNSFDTKADRNNSNKSIKIPETEPKKLDTSNSKMFQANHELNIPKTQHCRTHKQTDNVNYNHVVPSKKNKTSQLDGHGEQNNKHNFDVEKSKATKGMTDNKKLKYKLKSKHTATHNSKKTVSSKLESKKNVRIENVKKKTKSKLCDKYQKNDKHLSKKIVADDEFKDKLYFQTADNTLKCKFCDYNDKGLNIVRHYKVTHSKEEVIPSRLSEHCSQILIFESIKENFGHQYSVIKEDFKSIESEFTDIYFTCVFCKNIFYDIIQFSDHIMGHTGEYRYKCKTCDNAYPIEGELAKHILEHSDYDKNDGISNMLYPNPIYRTKLFGYLCSFCNYVQLDYNNIVKHMTLRHFNEDEKLNGYWTVIRISMTGDEKIVVNSTIDYTNLVGCLPPIQYDVLQEVSESNHTECENNVASLVAHTSNPNIIKSKQSNSGTLI